MKKLEYILMGLTTLCALFGIFINFSSGISSYIWNINTIVWIMIAFIKTRELNSFTEKVNQNSKS
jgi:hypothetical protein